MPSLLLSRSANTRQKLIASAGKTALFTVTSASMIAVLFIFFYIAKDAIPFFQLRGVKEFFTSPHWYPSAEDAEFGVLPIFFGSAIVTVGAILVAVPLGVSAAVCLSDVLPFEVRQYVKPVIEMLAAIPSVAYGFFALIVFAPQLQENGGSLLSVSAWIILSPVAVIAAVVLSDLLTDRVREKYRLPARLVLLAILGFAALGAVQQIAQGLSGLEIPSGTNALNVAIILGIMALPTVVSVSEDALQAAGRELREGSYALGATRAETILRVIIPAASSGICAAIILGIMRAIGETMVVWMASGNSARIPVPWFNILEPIRTLTATIAGDMGEADQTTGSARYHVLFAMALCLLVFSFVLNMLSEWVVSRARKKLGK